MKINIIVIVLLTFLVSCNSNKSKEQTAEQIYYNASEFPKFNAQFSNKKSLLVTDKSDSKYELDSTQYLNWTDIYTPFNTEFGRLYSAELYSTQPQIDGFAILTLRTNADHWIKLHLVTVNKNLELIDHVEVSNDWSDLLEQAGDTEIVGKERMYTNMISNSEYQNIDIRTTEIIDYYTDSTTFEVDSVVTKIEILNNGYFRLAKQDSLRRITHSNNGEHEEPL